MVGANITIENTQDVRDLSMTSGVSGVLSDTAKTPATSDVSWLGIDDLNEKLRQSNIVYRMRELRDMLAEMLPIMPDKIMRKAKRGSKKFLLRSDAFDEFCTRAELCACKGDWLSTPEVHAELKARNLMYSPARIRAQLCKLASEIPDKIQKRRCENSNRLVYCLCPDAIEEFCDRGGFLRTQDGWLSASGLTTKLRAMGKGHAYRNVLQRMNQLKPFMPGKLVEASIHGQQLIVLRPDAVEEFFNKSGFLTNEEDWLSCVELHKVLRARGIEVSNTMLRTKMMDLRAQMPHRLAYLCCCKNNRRGICVHRDGIEEFCRLANINAIPPKTDEWLNANELGRYVLGATRQKLACMREWHKVRPDAVQTRARRGKSCLCLNIDYVVEFCNATGLGYREPNTQKTPDWLSVTELQEFIVGANTKINDALNLYSTQMPYAIQKKRNLGGMNNCLHRDYIEEFCERSGLTSRASADYKTKDWLNCYQLGDYFVGGTDKIASIMKDLAEQMPHALQYKRRGVWHHLCLHRDHIKEFAIKSGLRIYRRNFWINTPADIAAAWQVARQTQNAITDSVVNPHGK